MSESPNSKLYMLYIHIYLSSMIQEIQEKKLGMIAPKPGTNLQSGKTFVKIFVRSSRWGHHFLGHALVVRRAQCPCWIYCCQKKWFFLMFKFGCCFPAFCYNTIHLDPRYFRRNDFCGSHDWGLRLKVSQPLSSAKKSCRRCKFLASLGFLGMGKDGKRLGGFLGILRTQYFNKGTWHLWFSLGFSHTDHTNFVGTYPA